MPDDFPNEFIKIRRPRPMGVFKMLLSSLLDFTEPVPTSYQGSLSDLTDPEKLKIVYIGHATLFINFFGTTILTDPVFADRVGFLVKRKIAPALKPEKLPPLDFVLVSHAHLDHFNRPTLKKLAAKTKTLIISKNCSDLVRGFGFKNIIEMHWEEIYSPSPDEGKVAEGPEGLKILAFRPQHWGTRMPWEKIHRGYNSYLIQKAGVNILFGGDSGYTEAFKKISLKYDIDIIMLPITAYNPPEFRKMHMNPEDAMKVFEESKAQYLVPIHWGVFRLSLEPMNEPPRLIQELMQKAGLSEHLKLLRPGQAWDYPQQAVA